MGILSIYTDVSAQVGENPRRVKIITTDNLATVTTAGYLNPTTLEGYTIFPTDIIDMWYGAIGSPSGINSPGTYSYFVTSISNGIITLSDGSSQALTINGDNGSATGNPLQINGGGLSGAGKTVLFNGSGSTLSLTVTDSNNNTFIGKSSGNNTSTGPSNTGIGGSVLGFLTSGGRNTSIGYNSGDGGITSGSDNIFIGTNSGANYTGSESSNICIGSKGILGDSSTTRVGYIGGSSSQTATYIDGIVSSTSNTSTSIVIDSNGRLYSRGLPGTVTQTGSISNQVTLNTMTGIITTVSATVGTNANISFTLNNSLISSTNAINAFLTGYSGTNGVIVINVFSVTSGSCSINISNVDATFALNGILKIGFQIL